MSRRNLCTAIRRAAWLWRLEPNSHWPQPEEWARIRVAFSTWSVACRGRRPAREPPDHIGYRRACRERSADSCEVRVKEARRTRNRPIHTGRAQRCGSDKVTRVEGQVLRISDECDDSSDLTHRVAVIHRQRVPRSAELRVDERPDLDHRSSAGARRPRRCGRTT
jgi:hypothetical protein